MTYEDKFIVSLLITWLLEGAAAPFVVLLLRLKKVKWVHLMGVVFLVSALTLPYLWFIVPEFVDARMYIWYGEGFVILVEMLLYWWLLRVTYWQAAVLSIAVNLFSYFVARMFFLL